MADNASTGSTGASGSAPEGGAVSAPPSSGNPNVSTSTVQNDGAKGASGEKKASSVASSKPRSLAELRESIEGGDAKLTPSEAKRIKTAALKGFTTEEEIDASLNSEPTSRKKGPAADKSGQNEDDADGDDLELLTDGNEDQGDDSENEGDDTLDEDSDDADETDEKKGLKEERAELAKAQQELNDVLKEISPNIKSAKDAVESLKNLRKEFSNRGAKLNEYEKQLSQLDGLDQSIAQMLQTPDGIAKLQQHYGVQPNGSNQGGNNPNGQFNAGQQLSQHDFDGMDDESILTKGQVQNVVKSLVDNHLREMRGEMQQWNQERGQIREVLTSEAQRRKAEQSRRSAISDWSLGAKMMGDLLPDEYGIKTPVEKIWSESIDEINENGRSRFVRRPDVHPEFEKLVRIMNLRDEFVNRSDATNFQDFLLRHINQTGTFQKLLRSKEASARGSMMDQRVDAVTSRLPNAGRRNVSPTPFSSNSEEFERLPEADKKKQSRQILAGVRKGAIKIAV